MKDLTTIGDTVEISVTKEGVRFSASGDIGSANIICRQNTTGGVVGQSGAGRSGTGGGPVNLLRLLTPASLWWVFPFFWVRCTCSGVSSPADPGGPRSYCPYLQSTSLRSRR